MNTYPFEVRDGGGQTLQLIGELDLLGVEALHEAIAGLSGNGALTLDLSELTYIDSSGLHAIVECANSVNGRGGVRITNANAQVVRVFGIVKLDVHPNVTIETDGDGS